MISGETAPHFVIRKAFQNHFDVCCDFDWIERASRIGLAAMLHEFLEKVKAIRPEYCFMQLQNMAAMDASTIGEISKYSKVIHWSGDVRNSQDWYEWMASLGRQIYLTVLCNETDVEIIRAHGVRADYLPIGFDNIYYQRRRAITGWPEIVFVANNYDSFELSSYRTEITLAMYEAFPGRFRVFGNGWNRSGIQTQGLNNGLEAECYNSCKLALSISNFNYSRYYSDRLLRIMGSGGCAVSHYFPGLERDFTPGYDLVTFTDQSDLVAKCNYYLTNEAERKQVGDNALVTAHTKCTWDARCAELLRLIGKYA